MAKSISRRDFIKGMAGITAASAVTALSGIPAASAEGETELVERVTAELPIPEVEAPAKTEYECDVLVIGGGFAGLNAAAAAAYAATAELTKIPAERIEEETEKILAPLSVEKGFDPNWARDQLMNIMGRQQDFPMDDAALACVVVGHTVPLVCQRFAASVGGCCNG